MDKINAVITGVGGYVPEDVLTNEDISKLVDTTDEWIMTAFPNGKRSPTDCKE